MTVMFPQFFGVPQSAMRRGILKGLSGSAIKLYIALCHESERCRSRELKRTVSQLRKLVGGAPNSHVKARRELARAGLVQFVNRGAEGFVFRLCDPVTSQPWPGDPKEPVPYQKKLTVQPPRSSIVTQSDPLPSQVQNASPTDAPWRATVPHCQVAAPIERSSGHRRSNTQVAINSNEDWEPSKPIPPELESPFPRWVDIAR